MPINMQIEYPKLEAENIKLKRLLHDLTPGGSEFYNDPEYCAKWIKETRQAAYYTSVNTIKSLKSELQKANADKEELLGSLARIINAFEEDAIQSPEMTIKISVETNNNAIEQGKVLITKHQTK